MPLADAWGLRHAQVRLLGKHIGKDNDEIERVIARPSYFNPYEAVDFGIIDRVRLLPACTSFYGRRHTLDIMSCMEPALLPSRAAQRKPC